MRTLPCLLIAATTLAHAASPNMELAKSVFDPRVMSNAEESPIPGLYQFAQGTEVFYISADGRYVMQGEMQCHRSLPRLRTGQGAGAG